MYKGLLFDLDGVIVDTAKYHYLAWKNLAESLGVEFTLEDNEKLKGVSRIQSFQIILEIGKIEMPIEEQQIYCVKKNNEYLKYIEKLTIDECLPGVKSFIENAKENGFKIGLGSASKNAKLILDKLELTELFDVIVDGTMVEKAKPDPEVFKMGAELLGLTARECIVFEDAFAGVEAAHSAGMVAVGIGSEENLGKAELCIEGFEDKTIEKIIEIAL